MRRADYTDSLLGLEGVHRVEALPPETIQKVAEAEASVNTVTGRMRLENIGMFQCVHRSAVFVMFCDGSLPRPEEVTMRMIDSNGTVIGHDITPSMEAEYRLRNDVLWVSDGFVMYPERVSNTDAKFVISSARFGQGCFGGVEAVVFYPSVPTAEMLNRQYGVGEAGISTLIVGADGVEGD